MFHDQLLDAFGFKKTAAVSVSRSSTATGRRFATAVVMIKGILAGAAGGLVGTWAMSHAQRLWTRAVDERVPESAGGKHDARDWQERSEGQNSNELAAQAVATRFWVDG